MLASHTTSAKRLSTIQSKSLEMGDDDVSIVPRIILNSPYNQAQSSSSHTASSHHGLASPLLGANPPSMSRDPGVRRPRDSYNPHTSM